MNEDKSGPDIPLWKLERYLIGELPPAEMARIDKLKSQDPEVADWIKALQAEHADLKASHPTESMADGIRDRLNGPSGAGNRGAAQSGRTAQGGRRHVRREVIGEPVGDQGQQQHQGEGRGEQGVAPSRSQAFAEALP